MTNWNEAIMDHSIGVSALRNVSLLLHFPVTGNSNNQLTVMLGHRTSIILHSDHNMVSFHKPKELVDLQVAGEVKW